MESNLLFVHLTSFEVTKIELLDFPSNNSILDMRVADYNKSSQVALANILQNVEKSYDKGKFLLEESKKTTAGTQFSEDSKF